MAEVLVWFSISNPENIDESGRDIGVVISKVPEEFESDMKATLEHVEKISGLKFKDGYQMAAFVVDPADYPESLWNRLLKASDLKAMEVGFMHPMSELVKFVKAKRKPDKPDASGFGGYIDFDTDVALLGVWTTGQLGNLSKYTRDERVLLEKRIEWLRTRERSYRYEVAVRVMRGLQIQEEDIPKSLEDMLKKEDVAYE
jgi:hypothetical protein